MKKIVSILLVALMALALCASAVAEPLPEEIHIGLIMHNTSTGDGANAKKLVDHAAEAIGNVKLTWVVEVTSPEKQIEAAENLIVAGVDGILILNVNDDLLLKLDEICADAEVYYGQMWRYPADPAVAEVVLNSEWYVGGCREDEFAAGYNSAKALFEQYGAKNIAVHTTPVGDTTHDARNEGFDAACAEFGLTRVAEVRGSGLTPADVTANFENFFTSVADLDAVFMTGGSGGQLDGALQAYKNMGKSGEVALAAIDFVEQLPEAFESGSIQVISGGQDFDPYFGFIVMVNKLAGTPLADGPVNISLPLQTLTNAEDARGFNKYFAGEVPLYDAEEVRAMIKVFNPEFDAAALQEVADNYNVANAAERHAHYFE